MELLNILSQLRGRKLGAGLIAVQIAVTLAVLCNGIFIIQQRLTKSARPSGVDEANLVAISNQWIGQPGDIPARIEADLAALRSLPGVIDAIQTNSFPLSRGGWGSGLNTKPSEVKAAFHTAIYMTDVHGLKTFDVHLVAGRNFEASEIGAIGPTDQMKIPAVLVSEALAKKLFPAGDALGKMIYFGASTTGGMQIVGIMSNVQQPWAAAESVRIYDTMLVPLRLTSNGYYYIIRARPGELATVMQAAQDKLFEISRQRVLSRVMTFSRAREEAFRDDRSLAILLMISCVALCLVTAFGIVGLTSYWVTQRQRQIGIRRALGATRLGIIRYFLTENVVIVAGGIIGGIGLTIGGNLWLISSVAMERLDILYPIVGVVVVFTLSQFAAFWPALRASMVPPAVAVRNA